MLAAMQHIEPATHSWVTVKTFLSNAKSRVHGECLSLKLKGKGALYRHLETSNVEYYTAKRPFSASISKIEGKGSTLRQLARSHTSLILKGAYNLVQQPFDPICTISLEH